jgi:hypothetical protein
VPSILYPNRNSIWFDINPQFIPQTKSEEYYFNNYAEKNFFVLGDKVNPLLDVTFNGIQIMNNDIVSPHPAILITVMDENKFLALNNPAEVTVYLRNIATQPTPILITYGPQMSFTPAVLPNNKCQVLFNPTLTDGTYELTVQAINRSGIPSANNNYVIDFKVITEASITNVVNYPNPFSTSTRFVFTLTGEELPTFFKIQIMTITGKVVREIMENELGPLHIGTNITEYAWDGTDKYGDKLANGLYLYHVVTSENGIAIEHSPTAADQYFKMGWGKMYIIR